MASSTTQITNLQFITGFISYAFWPTQTQIEKKHLRAIRDRLSRISKHIIIHIILHLICAYFISRCNFVISNVISILLYSYHLIDLIADAFSLRDGIIFDLRRYISRNTSLYTKAQYFNLYHSITKYKSYLRYYYYNQDKQMECNICRDEFDNINYNNQCLIACGHRFHKHCLKREEIRLKKLGQKLKCPACRQIYYKMQHKFNFNPNFIYGDKLIYTQIPSYIKKPRIKINKYRSNIEHYLLSSLPFYAL